MKRVFSGRNEIEAHFVRNALEAEGIQATVEGETLATGAVPMLKDSMPSVWVREEDAERARKIVDELPQGEDRLKSAAPVAGWTCPECKEQVEEQFDACWKCGRAKPGTETT